MKNVRFLWGLVGSLLLLLSVVSWGWWKVSGAAQTVAAVDGTSITDQQWVQLLKQKYGQQTLQELINHRVVLQEADKLGLQVDSKQMDVEVEKQKQNMIRQHAFSTDLAVQGEGNQDMLKEQVRYRLLLEQIAARDVTVTDQEMQEYYSKHKSDFTKPAQVHVQQITVASEAEAGQIREELLNGADFANLAKSRSIDRLTAESGGDMGWVSFEENLPESVLEAMSKLSMKQDSDPLKTPAGYTIIRVVERKNAVQTPYKEAKDAIRRQVALAKAPAFDQVLEKLRVEHKITFNEKMAH